MTEENAPGWTYRCPSCGGSMQHADAHLRCPRCDRRIPIRDGIPDFMAESTPSSSGGFFDIVAPIYESPIWYPWWYRIAGGPFAPSVARARSLVADRLLLDGGRALDVACGTGLYTRRIARDATWTYGVDRSMEMLRRAKRNADRTGLEQATFARMDATTLHFPDESFDGISCCGALHLFADPDAAVDEIHRVLRPGRRFVGQTIASTSGGIEMPWAIVDRSFDVTRFDVDELGASIRRHGFTDFSYSQHGMLLFFSAVRS